MTTTNARYVLGDPIGRGGMAEVFSGAAHGSDGFQKPIAIKRLLPELANDREYIERLIGEAKLLVRMQHGNIVSVLDLARDGNDVFLVMEYIDGPSLRQLMKVRGERGLSMGIATWIVQAAAAGLAYAHARPTGAIVHADVSPSNILLTTSGEVRVVDFGIARREGRLAGSIEGKLAYMAPEQLKGGVTPRSDVFSLGIVLYELLVRRHPFANKLTLQQREERLAIIPPHVIDPEVPRGLDALCMRALAEDPDERFATMQELIEALGEERFARGWRDGAHELERAIHEVTPWADVSAPNTQQRAAIVTHSMIVEDMDIIGDTLVTPVDPMAPTDCVATITDVGDAAITRVVAKARKNEVATRPQRWRPTGTSPHLIAPMRPSQPLAWPRPSSPRLTTPPPIPRESAPRLPPPPAVVPAERLKSVSGGFVTKDPSATAERLPPPPVVEPDLVALVNTPRPEARVDLFATPAPSAQRAPTVRLVRTGRHRIAFAGVVLVVALLVALLFGGAPAAAPVLVQPAKNATPAEPPNDETTEEPASSEAVAPAPLPLPIPLAAIPSQPVEQKPEPVKRVRLAVAVAKPGLGTLRVETADGAYAQVVIANEEQETPGARFRLPSGNHVVKLRDPARKLEHRCTVTITPRTHTLTVGMDEGNCRLR